MSYLYNTNLQKLKNVLCLQGLLNPEVVVETFQVLVE